MHTEQDNVRRDWRLPDELWARIVPLLPPRTPYPLGCHRPRVDDRRAMDAIFFVLRTGCQWNALNHTRLCASSAAHRRFQEWAAAGVFVQLWQCGLAAYDAFQGLDGAWLAMDGAMTKVPLGGGKGRQEPHRSREDWDQAQPAHRRRRRAYRSRGGGSESARLQDGAGNPR